jgi:hypothetical protein
VRKSPGNSLATREGIELVSTVPPEDVEKIHQCMTRLGVWGGINDTIKWARLYGSCIGVILIDSQDGRKRNPAEGLVVQGKQSSWGLAALIPNASMMAACALVVARDAVSAVAANRHLTADMVVGVVRRMDP